MSDLWPYLAILAVLIGLSAFFSGTEVAMFSLRRVDREHLLRSELRSEKIVLRLLSRPRRLIATILIGNESVNVSVSVVTAALVETAASGLGDLEMGLLATSIALPLLLLLGEISPKTIAMKTQTTWSRRAAQPLWLFDLAITPVRFVVRGIADVLMFPFGGSTHKTGPRDISEDEFKALVDAGSLEGQVDARERRLIHKVFEFGDKTVAEAMLPRAQVFALSYDLPLARLIKEVAGRGYSRVPVYQKSLDEVRGILYARDLVAVSSGASSPRKLSELLHEPLFVPQTTRLERLFSIFKQGKTHMALVVNEYGKLAGIVTMEDVLEELFGEIRDEREVLKSLAAKVRAPTEVTAAQLRRVGTEDPA